MSHYTISFIKICSVIFLLVWLFLLIFGAGCSGTRGTNNANVVWSARYRMDLEFEEPCTEYVSRIYLSFFKFFAVSYSSP